MKRGWTANRVTAAVAVVMMLAGVPARGEIVFTVSPKGDDAWSGRLDAPNAAGDDGPFRTLERARDAVRASRKSAPDEPVTVELREGAYPLARTLEFTKEDGGTEDAPVTWRAREGERVLIHGARAVTGWTPWRDGILKADLKAQGLGGVVFHQLFYRGERAPMARHPDLDPLHPRTGGHVVIESPGPDQKRSFVYRKGSLPFEEWSDISQAEVLGVYTKGWNFAIAPIEAVDTETRTVRTRPIRNRFIALDRIYVRNVRDALDAPGEWYLDRKESVLYFKPPGGAVADGEVMAPAVDHLFVVSGSAPFAYDALHTRYRGKYEDAPLPDDAPALDPVEHLHFRGLEFRFARQDALRMMGARHCSVVKCKATNVGSIGFNLGGCVSRYQDVGNPRLTPATGHEMGVGGAGQDLLANDPCVECRVIGCDVRAVGADGIFLFGRRNLAENNHVYDSGRYDGDCACVNLWGEDNVARRNTLHDVGRNAGFQKGVRNVLEFNDIFNTDLETCDAGAIRMCNRNPNLTGNAIRHNRIVNTVGYGFRTNEFAYQSPYYSWGIYLDNISCGTIVIGNIVVNTGRAGFMIHGGADMLVENNIFVGDGQEAVTLAPRRDQPFWNNRFHRNIIVAGNANGTVYRYGNFVEKGARFRNNLVWSADAAPKVMLGGKGNLEWDEWMGLGLDEGSVVADPKLQGPEASYLPAKDSPAWGLGFERIPVERIGCYADADRRSWPLVIDPKLARREEPVIYKVPVTPTREDFETDAVGQRPRKGDVADKGAGRIVVTDETAAAGKNSLKFLDAPNLENGWLPRLYYPFRYKTGVVQLSFDLRLDGRRRPSLYLDPRQYSDAPKYYSGPMLHIDDSGALKAKGRTLATLPFDRWVNIALKIPLGDKATGASQMVISVEGAGSQTVAVPHQHRQFRRLERVVIASTADAETVFYLDNVEVAPLED